MLKECGIEVICVFGSWGSGTTSVAGYLSQMGLNSCPTLMRPTTPSSFELEDYRQACLKVFDEMTLAETGSRAAFVDWLRDWLSAKKIETASKGLSSICLEHPLSAFLIFEIAEVADPTWVLVTQKFSDIEKNRERLQLSPTFGAQGAHKVYSRAISDLIAGGHSYVAIAIEDFIAHQEARDSLIGFANLKPTESQIRKAEGWIK